MITIEEISTKQGFLNLKDVWNNVLENSESKSIFSTFEWLHTWWECFGNDKKLFILLARDGEKILGIAPIMIENRKKLRYFPVKTLLFIGTGLSDYADFIIIKDREGVLDLFFEYLMQKNSMWDAIDFKEIKEDSPSLVLVRKHIERKGWISNSRVIGKCSYIKTTITWDEYYSSLSKNWKRDIRKKYNRMQRSGLSYSFASEEKSADGIFADSLLDIHFNGMAMKKKKSVLGSEKANHFFKAVINKLKMTGMVAIDIMRINDKVAAYALGFKYKNIYYHWNMGKNQEYDRYSPGNLLFCHMLEEAFVSNCVEEFDTLRGEEEWKRRWPRLERNNYQIEAIADSFYMKTLLIAHHSLCAMKRIFRKRDALR